MKESFLKDGIKEINNYIDFSTGEILDVDIKTHKYLANNKEEFLLLYSSMLSVFMNMEQSEIRVFGFLLQYADGTIFSIDRSIRMEISKVTKLAERTIYNTVKILEEKKLIFKHLSGAYQVNPRYAFRGSTNNRNSELKAMIEIYCKEC